MPPTFLRLHLPKCCEVLDRSSVNILYIEYCIRFIEVYIVTALLFIPISKLFVCFIIKSAQKSCPRLYGLLKHMLTNLIMWEARALIAHKAAEKRHWDEAEEDDEENCTTDYSLGLWAAKARRESEVRR